MGKDKSAKLASLDIDTVRHFLATEPDIVEHGDGTRIYEEAVVRLIDDNDSWDYDKAKKLIVPLMEDPDEKVAYAAFYALCTFFRRNMHTREYGELLRSACPAFREKASYSFLSLMFRKMENPNDWRLIEEADRLCRPDVLGYNYGVMHCFAEYVADACEKEPSRAPYFIAEHMELAMKRVNEALQLSNGYPKFYVTRARLRTIKAIYCDAPNRDAVFRLAQNDLDRAISEETNRGKKMDYQLVGLRMQSEYYEQILSHSIDAQETVIDEKLRDSNVKNLEFLSFFSAIIGLLLAGTQLMLDMKFPAAATLIVVLTGCLVLAFGTMGFVLHGKKRFWINILIVLIGIAITVGAMLYGAHYVPDQLPEAEETVRAMLYGGYYAL